MKNEFVIYEQALALKELGFDEPCFGRYGNDSKMLYKDYSKELHSNWHTIAPLYQQAFRWFREKYDLDIEIERKWKYSSNHNPTETFIRFSIYNFKLDRESREYILDIPKDVCKTYEEAELECLKKLIELCKKN